MKINGSSNRTFMELKYVSIIQNRNTTVGSNRTFMELKLLKQLTKKSEQTRSNRTFMELKFAHKNVIVNLVKEF